MVMLNKMLELVQAHESWSKLTYVQQQILIASIHALVSVIEDPQKMQIWNKLAKLIHWDLTLTVVKKASPIR